MTTAAQDCARLIPFTKRTFSLRNAVWGGHFDKRPDGMRFEVAAIK